MVKIRQRENHSARMRPANVMGPSAMREPMLRNGRADERTCEQKRRRCKRIVMRESGRSREFPDAAKKT
jgi:hypothetical protein